jgi:co-chaperonin GroES (HSP10)
MATATIRGSKIRPVGTHLLIDHVENDRKTSGGIVLPDRSGVRVNLGVVLAISAKIDQDKFEYPFEVGETVIFDPAGLTAITDDRQDRRWLLDAESVLAVVGGEESEGDHHGWRPDQ